MNTAYPLFGKEQTRTILANGAFRKAHINKLLKKSEKHPTASLAFDGHTITLSGLPKGKTVVVNLAKAEKKSGKFTLSRLIYELKNKEYKANYQKKIDNLITVLYPARPSLPTVRNHSTSSSSSSSESDPSPERACALALRHLHKGSSLDPDQHLTTPNANNPHFKKAINYFEIAAKQEHPRSFFYLGIAYNRGYGVEINVEKAIEYFKKASDLGLHEASYHLGHLYMKKSTFCYEAEKYLNLAKSQGSDLARESLITLAILRED